MSDEDELPGAQEELAQLLEELRVILPGVEILFAFLLTVPFTSRFQEVTVEQRYTYFVAFVGAAIAVTFLIAPAMLHRIQSEPDDIRRLLRISSILTLLGTGSTAVSVTAVVFMITELLFGGIVAAFVAAGIAGLAIVLWFGIPFYRRL